MSPLLAAMLWAPLSLALHTAAHEGAHAVTGAALGHRVERIQMIPGRTYFGPGPWSDTDSALVYAAPFALEALYAPLAMALLSDSSGIARAVLLVEVAMSIGFLTVWALSSDGREFQAATGAPVRFALMFPLSLTIGLVIEALK